MLLVYDSQMNYKATPVSTEYRENEKLFSVSAAPAEFDPVIEPEVQSSSRTKPQIILRLQHPGHEAVANFLGSSRRFRSFGSRADLAEYLCVTRATLNSWTRRKDVLMRVIQLTKSNKLLGRILAASAWPALVEALVRKARGGDAEALILVQHIANAPRSY